MRKRDIEVASQFRALCTDSRKLVQRALDLGWTARVSTGGHVILRSPDGRTTESVSRKLSRHASGRDRVIRLLNQQERTA